MQTKFLTSTHLFFFLPLICCNSAPIGVQKTMIKGAVSDILRK